MDWLLLRRHWGEKGILFGAMIVWMATRKLRSRERSNWFQLSFSLAKRKQMGICWDSICLCFEHKHLNTNIFFFFLENDNSFAKDRRGWRELWNSPTVCEEFSSSFSSGRKWGRSGWWKVVYMFPCFATFSFSPNCHLR